MKMNRALYCTKDFLSNAYEEDICREIIRNSVLDLRKPHHKLKDFEDRSNHKVKRVSNIKRNQKLIQTMKIVKASHQSWTWQVDVDGKRKPSHGSKFDKSATGLKKKKSLISHCSVGQFHNANYVVGSIIWSRLFFCESWPAMVITADLCGQKETSSDRCWVFWFGDHKISEVPRSRIYDFRKHFKQCYNSKNAKKSYVNGIFEALKECWIRLNKSSDILDRTSLLQWSLNEFLDEDKMNDQLNIDVNIPEWIALILKKYTHETNAQFNEFDSEISIENEMSIISKAVSVETKDVCMACKSCSGPNEHPFFFGQMCHPCKDRLLNSVFKFDEDGFNTYCIICAQPGELFLCDRRGCNKVYCSACLMFFIGEVGVTNIRHKSTWSCFLCSAVGNEISTILKARKNWREFLELMYQPEPTVLPVKKVCLRVLSLFDGISTGKVVLDDLRIKTEIYFASEIDSDSLLVSKMRHSGGRVQWIGDVTGISFEKLQELSPIDLLIGGSPCNDFSIANPFRKGFDEDGTGVLFYEFFRILTSLREIQTPGRPLFWLFENVASMQKQCKSTISRFFNCYPALLDAKYFSAQRRPRLFWGNIPGMYCPPQYDKALSVAKLIDNLFPGRRSQVDKIKTVTTKLNSLIQNNNNELPVVMNDNEETLFWVPELERIFGFPDHYTDVGDLSRNKRMKLLGQAWSVHVIKHILSPLKDFFEVDY